MYCVGFVVDEAMNYISTRLPKFDGFGGVKEEGRIILTIRTKQ